MDDNVISLEGKLPMNDGLDDAYEFYQKIVTDSLQCGLDHFTVIGILDTVKSDLQNIVTEGELEEDED